MKDWPVQMWAAIITVVGTISGVVGKRSGSRADAAKVLTDGALEQVASMRTDLNAERSRGDRLEAAVEALRVEQRAERDWCDQRINQLVTALHAEGIDVPPPPARPA